MAVLLDRTAMLSPWGVKFRPDSVCVGVGMGVWLGLTERICVCVCGRGGVSLVCGGGLPRVRSQTAVYSFSLSGILSVPLD